MDSITQVLLGAVTAQLGFRQRIGKDASWVAAGTALIPDLDLLTSPILSLTGVEHTDSDMFVMHRGVSHSLLLVPFLGFVITALWWRFRKMSGTKGEEEKKVDAVSFWLLYLCVFVALFSAPLLDLFTSYGTQLFPPISNKRFAIDALPIVDIIYTPILIVTLVLCCVLRKLKTDAHRVTVVIGWVGFGLSVIYIMAGIGIRQVVLQKTQEHLEQSKQRSFVPIGQAEYRAYPQIPTIFVWRVTRHDGQSWTVGKVNVLFGLDSEKHTWNRVETVENEWTKKAMQLEDVQVFNWFTMRQMRASYIYRDGCHVVEFHDMRYGVRPESTESLWSTRVRFANSGEVIDIEHVRHYHRAGLGELTRRIWADLWSP